MSSNIVKEIFFSEQWILIVGLKYSVNFTVKRHVVPSFVVPFVEYRQSRFDIVLKGP